MTDDQKSDNGGQPSDEQLLAEGWPHDLIKATCDPFDYAAYVDGLGLVEFEHAAYGGRGWVVLHNLTRRMHQAAAQPPYPFDRGVTVALSAVRWVADAPCGS